MPELVEGRNVVETAKGHGIARPAYIEHHYRLLDYRFLKLAMTVLSLTLVSLLEVRIMFVGVGRALGVGRWHADVPRRRLTSGPSWSTP